MKKNKKAFLFQTVIIALILIFMTVAIVVILFGGPQGLYTKVGDFLKGIGQKYLPQKIFQTGTTEEDVIPKDVTDFYNNLVKTLNNNPKSDVEKCYIKYQKMPDSGSVYKVRMTQSDNGMAVELLKETRAIGETILAIQEVPNLKPCIVGVFDKKDYKDQTKNFYENWVDPGKCQEGACKDPDYQIYNYLTLNGPYDIYGLKLYDQGILYKAKKDSICFIPTIGKTAWTGGSHSPYGIHYTYLLSDSKQNIFQNMPECKTLHSIKLKQELYPILNEYLDLAVKDCINKYPLRFSLGQRYSDSIKNIENLEKPTITNLIDFFISGNPKEMIYDYMYTTGGYSESENLSQHFEKKGNYYIYAYLWEYCTDVDYMKLKDYKYYVGVCFKENYCFYSYHPNRETIAYYPTSINTQSEKYPAVNIQIFEQAI